VLRRLLVVGVACGVAVLVALTVTPAAKADIYDDFLRTSSAKARIAEWMGGGSAYYAEEAAITGSTPMQLTIGDWLWKLKRSGGAVQSTAEIMALGGVTAVSIPEIVGGVAIGIVVQKGIDYFVNKWTGNTGVVGSRPEAFRWEPNTQSPGNCLFQAGWTNAPPCDGSVIYYARSVSYQYGLQNRAGEADTCSGSCPGGMRPAWFDTAQDVIRDTAGFQVQEATNPSCLSPYGCRAEWVTANTYWGAWSAQQGLQPFDNTQACAPGLDMCVRPGYASPVLGAGQPGFAWSGVAPTGAPIDTLVDVLTSPTTPPAVKHEIIYVITTTDPQVTDPVVEDPKAPGWVAPVVAPTEVEVPVPLADETYEQYKERARAAGLLGDIPRSDLPLVEADPTRGPNATVTTAPEPGSKVPPYTTITVKTNPPDAPPPNANGGAPAPLPESTSNNCCPRNKLKFDFPVTCNGKFPCGIFSYASSVFLLFNVAPKAPEFKIPVPSILGGPEYHVDLVFWDAYMAKIRALMTFSMWVGAVWWIGTRLLRFDSTGDPGEAVDEGIAA
jgi:hypothetical protein